MKITVRTIPREGLDLDKTLEPQDVGFSDGDFQGLMPLQVKAHIERVGDTVVAHTVVRTLFTTECARCLESVEVHRSDEFDFDYKVEPATDAIDLGDDIRQEVILHLPLKVLCRQDCKGLCAGCGVNLNREACKCKRQ